MIRLARALTGCLVLASTWTCDPGALLGTDAAQGIEGVALRGPICPVATDEPDCADRPHQAWMVVQDGVGRRVVRFRTGEDGRFRVGLAPGAYRLVPESGDPFPVASDQEVEVRAGAFTQVVVSFDTGIR